MPKLPTIIICASCKKETANFGLGMCKECYRKTRAQLFRKSNGDELVKCCQCGIKTPQKYSEITIAEDGCSIEWFCKWCLDGTSRSFYKNICEECGRTHPGNGPVCIHCQVAKNSKAILALRKESDLWFGVK